MSATPQLILASASPRRQEMLRSVGVKFEIVAAEIDEQPHGEETSRALVQRLAQTKAMTIAARFPEKFILAADTIVALEIDGKENILGKPVDEPDARRMLKMLQGIEHSVLSAFEIVSLAHRVEKSEICESRVRFSPMSAEVIDAYINTGEPLDKAGAYGIQGKGGLFVDEIRGSYTNIVGLPLAQVLRELETLGLWSPKDFSTA